MLLEDLIDKLFDAEFDEITLVDNWRVYTLESGYVTNQKIQTLNEKYNFFGQDNKGNRLIIAAGGYVMIQYPPVERRHESIILAVREDNLRPVFMNEMTEDSDFTGNRQAPKLRYGYIWRKQLSSKKSALLERMQKESKVDFKNYEADPKSWALIETTMLNKTDTIPQLRISFEPNVMVDTERGIMMRFNGGFIAIDNDNFATIAIDQEKARGAVDLFDGVAKNNDLSIDELFKRLKEPLTELDGNYMVFSETDYETSLLSAIGNSV